MSFRADNIFLGTFAIFAIAPPYSLKTKLTKTNYKMHKLYSGGVVLVILGIYIHGQYGKFAYAHSQLPGLMVLFTQLSAHFVFTTLLIAIYSGVFSHGNNVVKMYDILYETQKNFNISRNKSWTTLYVTFVVFVAVTCHTVALDVWVWQFGTHWDMFKYYLGNDVLYVHFSLCLYIVFVFSQSATTRFASLNELLVKTVKESNLKIEEETKYDNINDHKIKIVSKWYRDIYRLIDLINKSFGTVLLCATLETIILVLNYVVIFMIYFITPQELEHIHFGYKMILYMGASWITTSVVSTY